MVSTINTKKRAKPVPGLKHPYQEVDWTVFSRAQIAEILGGIDPSMVSRYAEAFPEVQKHQPIRRELIWNFYVLRCWKMRNPCGWLDTFLKELEEMGEETFLKRYVYAIGGSREHCEELIEDFIAKQGTEKLIA